MTPEKSELAHGQISEKCTESRKTDNIPAFRIPLYMLGTLWFPVPSGAGFVAALHVEQCAEAEDVNKSADHAPVGASPAGKAAAEVFRCRRVAQAGRRRT